MAALTTATPQPDDSLACLLASARTESGTDLLTLAHSTPILLIFLRHFGCPFARQTVADIAELQPQLLARNVRPVFIHLATPELARHYFDFYGLQTVERISDPEATLYRAPTFALPQQNPAWHLVNPAVWYGWLRGSLFKHGIGHFEGDGSQMPGLFFLRDAAIVRNFRYRTIAAKPNYLKLIQ